MRIVVLQRLGDGFVALIQCRLAIDLRLVIQYHFVIQFRSAIEIRSVRHDKMIRIGCAVDLTLVFQFG